MHFVDWCNMYLQLPNYTQNHPILVFYFAFHCFVMSGDTNLSCCSYSKFYLMCDKPPLKGAQPGYVFYF